MRGIILFPLGDFFQNIPFPACEEFLKLIHRTWACEEMQIRRVIREVTYPLHGNSKPVEIEARVLLGGFVNQVTLIKMLLKDKIDVYEIPQLGPSEEGKELVGRDIDQAIYFETWEFIKGGRLFKPKRGIQSEMDNR